MEIIIEQKDNFTIILYRKFINICIKYINNKNKTINNKANYTIIFETGFEVTADKSAFS